MRNDLYCQRAGSGWHRASAGNANAQAGTAPSNANSGGKAGVSTDGKSAGKCEGRAGHAGTSAEDRQRIESYATASGGGDSRRQGAPATVGPLSESNGGIHGRRNPGGIGGRREAG